MNAAVVIAGVAVVLWVLAKLGRALASIVETLAALAFLGFAFGPATDPRRAYGSAQGDLLEVTG